MIRTPARTVRNAHVPTLRPWLTVWIFMLAYLVSVIDRTVLTLMIVPLQRDLGISDTQFGLLHGLAFGLFFAIGGLPLGWLADRMSRRVLASICMAIWSLATGLSAFATSFGQLFLFRMALGVGEAGLNPTGVSLMADSLPREKLGKASAFYSSGAMVGAGLAYWLGGSVIGYFESQPELRLPFLGELKSWQVAFLLAGLPGLILVPLMLGLIREPPRTRNRDEGAASGSVWSFVRRNARLVSCHHGAICLLNLVLYSFMTWAPAMLLRSHGVSLGSVGLLMGIAAGIFGLLGFLAGGLISDWWLRRGKADAHMAVSQIGLILAIPSALLATLSSSLPLAAMGIMGVFFCLTMPITASFAALSIFTPSALRGRVVALFSSVANLFGTAVGAILVGFLNDSVFGSKGAVDNSLLTVSVLLLPIGATLFALARRPFGATVVGGVALSQVPAARG